MRKTLNIYLRSLTAITVLLMALSCQEDSLAPAVTQKAIRPVLSDENTQTRSTSPVRHETLTGVMPLGRVGDCDLYLHCYVSENTDIQPADQVMTRGAIRSDESLSVFRMDAWLDNEVQGYNTHFIDNVEVTKDGDSWNLTTASGNPYYWVDNTQIHFWSYAPSNLNLNVSEDRTTMTISGYVTPSSDDDGGAAEAQEDIIVAYNKQAYSDNNGGVVDIHMYHALAAIRFDVSDVPEDISVTDVALIGIKNAGDCEVTPSTGGMDFTWTAAEGSVGTFSQPFIQSDFHEEEVSGVSRPAVQDIAGEKIFFIMPQTLPEDATVMVNFHSSEGFSVFKTLEIGVVNEVPTVWEAGKRYTYKISTSAIEPLETANCYVVSEPGYSVINAFCMGNRQDCRLWNGDDENGWDHNPESLAAAVLWSDCGLVSGGQQAVTDVAFILSDDKMTGFISFKVNKDPATGEAYRGNVVVALYDQDTKEIIWSWHLWLTEEPATVYTDGNTTRGITPEGVIVATESPKNKLAVMDRNLGAISANPSDGWKTYGLYYQMGRKDPFVGASGNGSYTDRTSLVSTNLDGITSYKEYENLAFGGYTSDTWYNSELSGGWQHIDDYLNIPESIKSPMTSSNNKSKKGSGRWTLSSDTESLKYMNGAEHGLTGLNSSGHDAYWYRTKTAFDPCPAGWTVLGDDAQFLNSNRNYEAYSPDGVFAGIISHHSDGHDVWWPAAGFRSLDGRVSDAGYRGAYVAFDHIDATHGLHGMNFYIGNNKGSMKLTMEDNIDAFTNGSVSVRCVKAIQQ